MTDGGQAQAEPEADDESEADTEEEAEDDGEADAGEETEGAEEEAEAEPAEVEEESEGVEEEPAEAEEDEAEEEDEEGLDVTGDLVEDDRAEGHADDAETVYEGDDASGVLHLDLDGLFLDLLGLEVNLNPVTLDVSARPGGGNLLGNLLSAVTGLLDGPGALLDKVTSLLGKPLEWLGSLTDKLKSILGKPKEWLGSLSERVKSGLSDLVRKPGAFLRSLFGRGEAEDIEEGAAEEPVGEEEGEEAEAEPGRIASAVQWVRSTLSGAAGWLKEKLVGLVPGLPVEEVIATIVRSVIQQLLEQLEPEGERDEADAQEGAPAEA